MDIELDLCRKEVLSEIDPNFESDNLETATGGGSTTESSKSNTKTLSLKSFGRELTALAVKVNLIRNWS